MRDRFEVIGIEKKAEPLPIAPQAKGLERLVITHVVRDTATAREAHVWVAKPDSPISFVLAIDPMQYPAESIASGNTLLVAIDPSTNRGAIAEIFSGERRVYSAQNPNTI
ncbi:hypothetical protein HYU16_03810 [Candidatus Woesearchaeota archaeon]|nr:hypothetical protein [Candidatus Woesearchaeota archaeon]